MILAPIAVKRSADKDAVAAEERIGAEKAMVGFRPVYVWDESQTDGEPLAEISDDQVIELFGQITELKQSSSKRDAARQTGERLGLTAKQVYDIIERNK